MKLTPRGRGVAAGAIVLALLLLFVWAAVKDATMAAYYQDVCPPGQTCTTR